MTAARAFILFAVVSNVQAFVPEQHSVHRTQHNSPATRESYACNSWLYSAYGEARRRLTSGVLCMATDLDKSAEYVKAELARVQEEYEANRKAKMVEQTRQAAARGDAAVTPLAELPFVPYIDENGLVTNAEDKSAKASVYAIYDESKTMRYIGVSRGVQQSLRLHLARRPSETHFFKVQHISRPSRSLLEIIKDSWVAENGSIPKGNDEGESQALWENPLNVIPLFTEEDKAFVAEKKEKGREETGIKTVARRFEGEKVKILEERGVKESMRFDPKLKGRGLLDLYIEKAKPDTSVPK